MADIMVECIYYKSMKERKENLKEGKGDSCILFHFFFCLFFFKIFIENDKKWQALVRFSMFVIKLYQLCVIDLTNYSLRDNI